MTPVYLCACMGVSALPARRKPSAWRGSRGLQEMEMRKTRVETTPAAWKDSEISFSFSPELLMCHSVRGVGDQKNPPWPESPTAAGPPTVVPVQQPCLCNPMFMQRKWTQRCSHDAHPPPFNHHILQEIRLLGGRVVYIFRVYSKRLEKEAGHSFLFFLRKNNKGIV